jgi:hypothetical protein
MHIRIWSMTSVWPMMSFEVSARMASGLEGRFFDQRRGHGGLRGGLGRGVLRKRLCGKRLRHRDLSRAGTEEELGVADQYDVAVLESNGVDKLAVDLRTVAAAQVFHHPGLAFPADLRVAA